jgi:hypothetical protein
MDANGRGLVIGNSINHLPKSKKIEYVIVIPAKVIFTNPVFGIIFIDPRSGPSYYVLLFMKVRVSGRAVRSVPRSGMGIQL